MTLKKLTFVVFLCSSLQVFGQMNIKLPEYITDIAQITASDSGGTEVTRIIIVDDSLNNKILFNSGNLSDIGNVRSDIIGKACEYLGVIYRYGYSSEKGFDCSGFVKFVYKYFGYSLPHSSYALYKLSNHLQNPEAKPGDLVFFITRGKNISHVGIYLGDNQFIHAPGKGRSVSIDSLNLKYYKKHFVCFGSVL